MGWDCNLKERRKLLFGWLWGLEGVFEESITS